MEALNEINTLGHTIGLETKRLRDLPIDQAFTIIEFKRISTRFGDRVLCICDEFKVFLPARFARLSDASLADLNSQELYLKYLGMQHSTYVVQFLPAHPNV